MRDVDYTASVAFLRKFFAHTQDNVELRVIGNNNELGPRLFDRDPDKVLMFCQQNDRPGWAVYFGCATRIAGHRQGKRENLSEIICCLIDIDTEKLGIATGDAVAVLQGCPCPPSIIVFSGRGLHAYWLLREAADVRGWDGDQDDTYSAVLKRLAACFAADACHDLPRVMRLPGTHNSKEGGWRQCVVIDENDRRYELGDLAEMLDQLGGPLIVPLPGGETAIIQPDGPDDPFLDYGRDAALGFDVEAELAGMQLHHPQGRGVHYVRLRAAGSMVARGVDDEAIFERLLAETARAVAEGGERWTTSRERLEAKKLRDEIRGAHAKGWAPPKDGNGNVVQLRPGQAAPEPPDEPSLMGQPLNDLGNAFRLKAHHGGNIKYCVKIGWHLWDKRRYAYDPEAIVMRYKAHETVARMAREIGQLPGNTDGERKARLAALKFVNQSGNKGKIDGMLSEARAHVRVEPNDLDADDMLLNCLNGTIDLRTGLLRPHDQVDLQTKLCGAAYEPDAACPQWERFIREIFNGDMELVGFVQRALGYSLTGDTSEEVLFILHGLGANGKTVLIETVAGVLGDYVKRSPNDTWVASSMPQPTNDLASLVGARFVSVVETERDKNLAEARIKQATGGDKISAKFHYQEWFDYQPQFKLWFATNHKPKIRGSDYAIWRRVYLLPFLVRFVDKDKMEPGDKEKDLQLTKKLKNERAGILAWMVRGCLNWQHNGLRPPASVVAATEEYQDNEDNIAGFIRDCCSLRKSISCKIGLLYAAYEVWCEDNNEEARSKKEFGLSLTERGFAADRTATGRLRKGIDLQASARAAAEAKMAKPREPAD